MMSYLTGTSLLIGYTASDMHAVGSTPSSESLKKRYETLKRLPVSELRMRAERAIRALETYQTNFLMDSQAGAYKAALEQAVWQKNNGDSATNDADRQLAYARCIYMAEQALLEFAKGPGDSYWDTYLETLEKMRDYVKDAPGSSFEWLTGLPRWVFWLGGATVVGGIVYGGYQIAKVAAPVAVHKLLEKVV